MFERLHLKRSVVNDLILWLSLSLGLVVIVLGAALILLYTGQAESELLEKAEARTLELAKVLKNPMWNMDRMGTKQIADAYLQGENVVGVRVADTVNADGKATPRIFYEKGDFSQPDIIEKQAQVVRNNRIMGSVDLAFSRAPLHSTRSLIIRTVVLLMAGVIVFIYVLTRIIMRRLLHARIRALIDGIQDIAGGNYQKRLPALPQLDLSAVNTEINKMAKQIEARESTLSREIAERKSAEHALKNSERRYRGIFENSLDGIFQISPNGEPLNINSAMALILGFDSVYEFMRIVSNVKDLFVEQTQAEEFLTRLLERGRVVNIERRLLKKDGTCIWIQLQAQTINGKNNEIEYMEGFAKDVTARKLAEEELRAVNRNLEQRVLERTRDLEQANRDLLKAKEEADAAAQSKSRFLANMSHEIRTPMNGVITSADLALQEELPEKPRRYLSIIKNSGEQLLTIVNDILDFSKIDAGQMFLEKHSFNLPEFIDATVSSFIHKASEKDIELLIDIDPEIPLNFVGDSTRIRQVLGNLLSNALKFTDNNGVVTLGVAQGKHLSYKTRDQQCLEFAVSDTGTGMSPEEQSHLFKPFSQVDASTTRKYGGTGLGLAISKQLVEMMDGHIGVRSSSGDGSRFFFEIPLRVQSDAYSLKQVVPEGMKVKKVLIVDDCEQSNHLIRKIMHNCGIEAKTFLSARKLVRSIEKSEKGCDFDLIITDYKMPEMDGLELTRAVKRVCGEDRPVVMISAYENELTASEMKEAGVDVFLAKPLNQSLIMDTLAGFFRPVRVLTEHEKEQKQIASKLDVRKKNISGLRVLVAEDNSINQEIARDVLENAGVEVEVAKDGREALQAAHADKFDLILMDVQMPNMDGFEATYRIREDLNESAPPIVAMTAHALEGDQERCMRAGMAGYVSKPIKQEVLYKTIHNVLEKDRRKGTSGRELETAQKKGLGDKSASRFAPDKSVVDMEAALEDLGVGEEAILRVLGKFRDKYKDVLKDFRSLADSGDWTAFHDLAHSLKGSAGQLRVKLVQEAAYDLERETKTGTVDDAAVEKGLSELDAAINRMVQELQDI